MLEQTNTNAHTHRVQLYTQLQHLCKKNKSRNRNNRETLEKRVSLQFLQGNPSNQQFGTVDLPSHIIFNIIIIIVVNLPVFGR